MDQSKLENQSAVKSKKGGASGPPLFFIGALPLKPSVLTPGYLKTKDSAGACHLWSSKRFGFNLTQGKTETQQKISMSWAFRGKLVSQVHPETL
ncbi:hypothetical protein [Aliiroseovarius crassostreae]|uniref:hypothetical protein n=1 Tax=Aliiroseovarius crassostreae TaxID=154981 RepID=UPI003C7BBF95